MKLITFKHGVSGTVTLLDKSTIQIVDFSYDGKIHDAYFFFSTKSSKPGRADIVPIVYPSKVSKKPVPYNAGPDKLPILKRFKKETIELKLPLGYSTDELKWLSVYCRGYDVEFGTLVFPN